MCHPEVPAGQTTPDVQRQEVQVPVGGGESMPAMFASPEGHEGPGVLLINDIMGRSPFYESLAARLATAGFHVLLPEFFFREGPLADRNLDLARERLGKLDEPRALDNLSSAIDWLQGQAGVRGDRTGMFGFCLGGTYVLDLAARRNDMAGVCFYGFPAAGGGPKSAPSPLSQVDKIKGPLLGFWGDQDVGVGMDNVQKLADELGKRNVDFEYTIFPGLGHGFMAASQLDPNHDAYAKACEAWTRTVDFYRNNLGAKAIA